jgi:hypothetical protein
MAITFPASPSDGDVFTNSTTGVKYIYNATDGVWKTHVWPTNTDYLQLSGGTLTGNLSLGTNDLTAQDVTASGAISANSLSTTAGLTVGNGLTVSDGNVVMASGHGIDFSATADGSGTTQSELLDNYEEGLWSPYLSGSNSGSVTSFTERLGHYTRIGDVVIASFYLTNPGSNSGVSGSWQINGLPFGARDYGNYYGSGVISYIRGVSSSGWLAVSIRQDSAARTFADLYNNPNSTAETASVSGSVPSNLILRGNIIYSAI